MASLDGPQVSELLQPNGYARCVQLDRLLVNLWRELPDTGGSETFNRAQLLLCVALRLLSATNNVDALSVQCVATAMGFIWTDSFRQTFSNTSKKFLLLLQQPPPQQPPPQQQQQQQPPPPQQQPPPPQQQQPDDPLSASDYEMLAGSWSLTSWSCSSAQRMQSGWPRWRRSATSGRP